MHERETIMDKIRLFTHLENEGHNLLKNLYDRSYGMRPAGRLPGQIMLRISQYGAMRAYWERQVKKLNNRNKQSHV